MAKKSGLDSGFGISTIVGPNGELKYGTAKDLEKAAMSRAAQNAFLAGDRATYNRIMAQLYKGWNPTPDSP